jgi:tetraacyldisaccharide 4'-kinase
VPQLLLAPLSLLYGAAADAHRALTRPVRAAVPVISVGNLVAGGAGKTPVTLWLAQRLLERGRRPAVLSRGYGRRGKADLEVLTDTPALLAGDEPALLKRRCPESLVFVGSRRARLAALAAARGADVLLLDDGLQHHALARDLDIVVIDASNAFGNGHRLPWGPLRDSPALLSRLPRALVWLTRCDLPRDPRAPRGDVESVFEPGEVRLDGAPLDLRGKRVFLFAGVARPESFVATVRSLGAIIEGERWFPDHSRYSSADLAALRSTSASLLVTTEKDLVRIDPPLLAGAPPIVAVPVSLRVGRGEPAIDAALDAVLG